MERLEKWIVIAFYYVIYVYSVYTFSWNIDGSVAPAPSIDKPPLVAVQGKIM